MCHSQHHRKVRYCAKHIIALSVVLLFTSFHLIEIALMISFILSFSLHSLYMLGAKTTTFRTLFPCNARWYILLPGSISQCCHNWIFYLSYYSNLTFLHKWSTCLLFIYLFIYFLPNSLNALSSNKSTNAPSGIHQSYTKY